MIDVSFIGHMGKFVSIKPIFKCCCHSQYSMAYKELKLQLQSSKELELNKSCKFCTKSCIHDPRELDVASLKR